MIVIIFYRQNNKHKAMHTYDNLLEALHDLEENGFVTNFRSFTDRTEAEPSTVFFPGPDFEIIAYYRFEAQTDPDESGVLYVIQSVDKSIKGYLLNAYSIYSDAVGDSIAWQIQIMGVNHSFC